MIEEGDLNADYFYIVQSGRFNVFLGQGASEAKPVTTRLEAASAGVCLGQIAYVCPYMVIECHEVAVRMV